MPITGALLNLMLIATATRPTLIRLFAWMAIGLVVYTTYARRHSKLAKPSKLAEDEEEVRGLRPFTPPIHHPPAS